MGGEAQEKSEQFSNRREELSYKLGQFANRCVLFANRYAGVTPERLARNKYFVVEGDFDIIRHHFTLAGIYHYEHQSRTEGIVNSVKIAPLSGEDLDFLHQEETAATELEG